jgi:hypothetical protein
VEDAAPPDPTKTVSRLAHLRAFTAELFTVTCGILIALALQGLVERHRNAELARHARADFIAELTGNREKLSTVMAQEAPVLPWLRTMAEAGEALLHHQSAKLPDPPSMRRFPVLPQTAWATALATQALTQLSFAEVSALSTAYTRQQALNDLLARARDQWVSLASYGNLSAPDLATMPEEDIRRGIGDVRIAFAYAASIANLETQVIDGYKDAAKALGP